jgi:hypothetical protein
MMRVGKSIWSGLFARAGRNTPRLTLHTLGLEQAQLRSLRPLWESLGRVLELRLEADPQQGDIVLADRSFAARTAARTLASICAARPLITCDLGDAAETNALALLEHRQRELLRQLREIPLVRDASAQFGASGWGPEVLGASDLPRDHDRAGVDAPRLDIGHEQLVNWLLRGLLDPTLKPLTASYGPGAVLRIDFEHAYAMVDPLAQQQLRVRRELPRLSERDVPGPDAMARDLDALVWDFGIAAGQNRLLDQPTRWWNTPLASCKDPAVQRYTRLPRHLELAAVLFERPASPADLQRLTGQSVAEMRPFLQACLFLGLIWWAPES